MGTQLELEGFSTTHRNRKKYRQKRLDLCVNGGQSWVLGIVAGLFFGCQVGIYRDGIKDLNSKTTSRGRKRPTQLCRERKRNPSGAIGKTGPVSFIWPTEIREREMKFEYRTPSNLFSPLLFLFLSSSLYFFLGVLLFLCLAAGSLCTCSKLKKKSIDFTRLDSGGGLNSRYISAEEKRYLVRMTATGDLFVSCIDFVDSPRRTKNE